MKRYLRYLLSGTALLLAILALTPRQAAAQDGFFSNARTLERGTLTLGLQPVILNNQDNMVIGRIAYGLNGALTTHIKVGFPGSENYFGAHFEGAVAQEPYSDISIALLGGVYNYGDTGLKAGINFSKNFHPISLYAGLNYQPLFMDNYTLDALLVPVGLDLHLKPGTLDLMLEADIPVNDEGELFEGVTFGARIYLN